MAYVGNTPAAAYTSIAKQDITGNGGTSYTLDHSVANENEIEVFVNNVRQEPSIAYTVSNTTLTMTGDVEALDDFYVVFQGKAIQTTSHPEGQDLQARDGTFSGDVDVDGTVTADSFNGTAAVNLNNGTHEVGFGTAAIAGNGSSNDAVIDLGRSNRRFKNLYLSGGAYLGGTGSANHLDDYEEGTFTPTFDFATTSPTAGATSGAGNYTKIGNTVFASIVISNVNVTGASGDVRIKGLPFTATSAGGHLFMGAARVRSTVVSDYITSFVLYGNTSVYLENNSGSQYNNQLDHGDFTHGYTDVALNFSYKTDA